MITSELRAVGDRLERPQPAGKAKLRADLLWPRGSSCLRFKRDALDRVPDLHSCLSHSLAFPDLLGMDFGAKESGQGNLCIMHG